jgi:hypothetical protein
MNYYANLDPITVRGHSEKRLWADRHPPSGGAFALRRMLPLPR